MKPVAQGRVGDADAFRGVDGGSQLDLRALRELRSRLPAVGGALVDSARESPDFADSARGDVNQLRDATETATDRLVHLQRRGTSCTPPPPLGPESVSVQGRACRASKSTWPPKSSSAASRVGSLGPLSTQYTLATIKLSALVEKPTLQTAEMGFRHP